ncbi:MAG: hypothetical protein H6817_04315 [Phycisphaerales bacterium]|nr:hypothetical protein [Phycisphaerales bacterium]
MPAVIRIEQRLADLRLRDFVLFALVLGAASTYFCPYRYGFVNHIEQLPPILRALDPGLMPGDETVNELCKFGPRFYYVQLIAGMAHVMPLPIAYLLLTVLAHSATALVTLFAARRFFGGSTLVAMMSAVLVVSVSSIGIGGASQLFRAQLVPQTLATPLLLASLMMAFTNKPKRAVLFAMPGCLLHPLAGAHTAALGLATVALFVWLAEARRGNSIARGFAAACRRVALPAGLFGAFIYAAWVAPGGGHDYDLAFMVDFARFRSPHHHLPSHFSLGVYGAFTCFVAAMILAWRRWRADDATDRAIADRVAICMLAIFVLLLCGYVFVEVIPTKTFLMAQTFRLVFIIKWIGLMLFAATACRILKQAHTWSQAAGATITLIGTGPFQPGFALLGHLVEQANPSRDRKGAEHNEGPKTSTKFAAIANATALITATVALTILWSDECVNETFALLTGSVIVLCFSLPGVAWRRPFGALAGVLAIGGFTALLPAGPTMIDTEAATRFEPVFTLKEGTDSRDGVAAFVRDNTPRDAVVLAPPYFGRFRILAQRALVVDFKCMPYDAAGYARWRERLSDCYGEVHKSAGQAVIVMKNHYCWITPDRIQNVANKYGADYAVLYRRTPTTWPVLYSDERFKLVAIPPTQNAQESGSIARADNAPTSNPDKSQAQ